MSPERPFRLGLVVRSTAYQQRSPRTQLDVALLAATLDFDLWLFFTGAGVMQLVARGNTASAQLPAAYPAWGSLPDLFENARLQAYAESAWLDSLSAANLQPCLPVEAIAAAEMRQLWKSCDRVMVL